MLTHFQFESQEVRFVDGKPVAIDVARVLGYASPKDAIRDLINKKYLTSVKLPAIRYGENKPRMQDVFIISKEAGIYQLIFSSKLPIAEKFQEWVFEEVLPSICKTGSYSVIAQPKKAITAYSDRVSILAETLVKPPNTWCVIEQCSHLLLDVEKRGFLINEHALLDGSVGKTWGNYRNSKDWALESFTATYDFRNQRGKRTINAYQYPELGYFAQWLNDVYQIKALPLYLAEQVKKGKLVKV